MVSKVPAVYWAAWSGRWTSPRGAAVVAFPPPDDICTPLMTYTTKLNIEPPLTLYLLYISHVEMINRK